MDVSRDDRRPDWRGVCSSMSLPVPGAAGTGRDMEEQTPRQSGRLSSLDTSINHMYLI